MILYNGMNSYNYGKKKNIPITMKSCPTCGTDPVVFYQDETLYTAATVYCPKCGRYTHDYYTDMGQNPKTGVEQAADAWNSGESSRQIPVFSPTLWKM